MMKALGKNVLLKRINSNENSWLVMKTNNFYQVINIGEEVKINLIGKKVYVINNLIKIEGNEEYYLTNIDNVLAVEEE